MKESNWVRESIAVSSHFRAKVPRTSANNGLRGWDCQTQAMLLLGKMGVSNKKQRVVNANSIARLCIFYHNLDFIILPDMLPI